MPIKITPRATISDDFKLAMNRDLHRQTATVPEPGENLGSRSISPLRIMRQNGQSIAGLRALLQDQDASTWNTPGCAACPTLSSSLSFVRAIPILRVDQGCHP